VPRLTSRVRRWTASGLVGCLLVLIAAREFNSPAPSLFTRTVLAPVPVVVGLVPLNNIGTTEKPFYEGTPLHVLAALAALPLCALIWSVFTYALIALGQRLLYGRA